MLSFVGMVVVWEITARVVNVTFFLPPTEILAAAKEEWLSGSASTLWLSNLVFVDVIPSITRLIVAWMIAMIIGVTGGLLLGSIRMLDEYSSGFLEFARAMPPVALVPIFILFFGIGTDMKILVISFATVWPFLLNAMAGVRSLERTYIDTALVFSIDARSRFLHITVPALTPYVFAALRITSTAAIIVMVVSEMIGSSSGLGFRLLASQQTFQFGPMWAGIILLGVIGVVLNMLVNWAERRIVRWRPSPGGGARRVVV